jgi:hypothetical protein
VDLALPLGREGQGCADVLSLEIRKVVEDLVLAHPPGQELEYVVDGDSETADAGPSAPLAGFDRDACPPIHARQGSLLTTSRRTPIPRAESGLDLGQLLGGGVLTVGATQNPFLSLQTLLLRLPASGESYPKIFEHPAYGTEAKKLHADVEALLDRIEREGLLTARAVHGFWRAVADGDDMVLYEDEALMREVSRFPMLRQQQEAEALRCVRWPTSSRRARAGGWTASAPLPSPAGPAATAA